MNALIRAMKYVAATLIGYAVARVVLRVSVRLALLIDPGALFYVSIFLIAGAIYVFVVTFRKTLHLIERWIARAEERRKQAEMKK